MRDDATVKIVLEEVISYQCKVEELENTVKNAINSCNEDYRKCSAVLFQQVSDAIDELNESDIYQTFIEFYAKANLHDMSLIYQISTTRSEDTNTDLQKVFDQMIQFIGKSKINKQDTKLDKIGEQMETLKAEAKDINNELINLAVNTLNLIQKQHNASTGLMNNSLKMDNRDMQILQNLAESTTGQSNSLSLIAKNLAAIMSSLRSYTESARLIPQNINEGTKGIHTGTVSSLSKKRHLEPI